MEISYEKHGVEGIENCLVYLAAFDSDDIESDEFEIIGEDEDGREGSADISIVNLAEEACKALAAQRKRIAQLESDCAAHKAAEEVQIALRQKMEGERDALAAHVERFGECRLQSGRISLLRVRSLLSDSPTTSLARRDLLKQAEMLEFTAQRLEDNFGANSSMCFIDNTFLRRDARGLRERANRFGTLVKCRSCDGFGFLDNCDGCKACNESGEVVST